MPFPARTFIRATAFVVGILSLSASHAAEPKPDAEINIKEFGGRIYLDDKIKADALIAADCLLEGKKWIFASATATLKQYPDPYWSFVRHYTTLSVVRGRYVSILRFDEVDSNGVHPQRMVDTILWDKAINKRISIRPFFTETADGGPTMRAMQEVVIASLKAGKEKGEVVAKLSLDYIEPKLLKIGPVTLAPSTEVGKSSGLTFHYVDYTGYIDVFVPWKTLQPFLTPEGIRIFGGDRPKSDKDDEQ